MKTMNEGMKGFLLAQPYTVFTTIDKKGYPHSSCKGIVDIDKNGRIYLLDLYVGKTHENLEHNNSVNITVVNEHKFTGYCVKGKAHMINIKDIDPDVIEKWDKKIKSR